MTVRRHHPEILGEPRSRLLRPAKRAAALGAGVVLLAGCGSDHGVITARSTTTTPGAGTASTVAPGVTAIAPAGGGPSSTAGGSLPPVATFPSTTVAAGTGRVGTPTVPTTAGHVTR